MVVHSYGNVYLYHTERDSKPWVGVNMSKETRKQDGIMFQQTFNLQFSLTQQFSLDLNVPEELLNYWRTSYRDCKSYVLADFSITNHHENASYRLNCS